MAGTPALDALALDEHAEAGSGHYTAGNVPSQERAVVFGGQLLGQIIVAATRSDPAKSVRSVHAVFARAGDVSRPLEVSVDVLHRGRTMSTADVRVCQGDRTLCGGLVLLDTSEPDVLQASLPMPAVPAPDDLVDVDSGTVGAQIRLTEDVDLNSAGATGPAELALWGRWPDAGVTGLAESQALTAWFTDPYLIPAALRPHEGLGLAMAHDSLSTGVLAHTLTFHAPVDARDWLLFSQRVAHGGGGRVYGEGHVFTQDGVLVASFAQEAMVRAFPVAGGSGDRSTAM
jgi:acyl-CoA thioesterase